jgi:hypothetical protein
LRVGRKTKHEKTDANVLGELSNSHGVAPQQVFNDPQWLIAVLEVDDLGRPTQALPQFNKIGISRDHAKLVGFGPLEYYNIVGPPKGFPAYMCQARKKLIEAIY